VEPEWEMPEMEVMPVPSRLLVAYLIPRNFPFD
jgi:hypothetical protein